MKATPKNIFKKTKKKKKMSRENEFKIIPTTNTKRHKETDENDPKKYFKKTKKKCHMKTNSRLYRQQQKSKTVPTQQIIA